MAGRALFPAARLWAQVGGRRGAADRCSRAGTAPGTRARAVQDPPGAGIADHRSPPQGVNAGTAPPVLLNRVFLQAHSLLATDAHGVLRVRHMSNYVLFIQG